MPMPDALTAALQREAAREAERNWQHRDIIWNKSGQGGWQYNADTKQWIEFDRQLPIRNKSTEGNNETP